MQPSQIVLPHSVIRIFGYSMSFCECFACFLWRESPLCGWAVMLSHSPMDAPPLPLVSSVMNKAPSHVCLQVLCGHNSLTQLVGHERDYQVRRQIYLSFLRNGGAPFHAACSPAFPAATQQRSCRTPPCVHILGLSGPFRVACWLIALLMCVSLVTACAPVLPCASLSPAHLFLWTEFSVCLLLFSLFVYFRYRSFHRLVLQIFFSHYIACLFILLTEAFNLNFIFRLVIKC